MSAAEETIAAIAVLTGLGRARRALPRGGPVLAVGRRNGFGGARGTGGELPWEAGAMPVFGPDRPEGPGAASTTTIERTVSSVTVPQAAASVPAAIVVPVAGVPGRDGMTPDAAPALPRRGIAAAVDRAPPQGVTLPVPSPKPLPATLPTPTATRLAGVAPAPAPAAQAPTAGAAPQGALQPTARLPGAAAPPHVTRPPAVATAPNPATSSLPPARMPPSMLAVPIWRDAPETPRESPTPPAPALPRIAPPRAVAGGPALPGRAPTTPDRSPLPTPPPPLPLIQRAPRAAPASVSNVVALGERIERSVRQEIDEVRAMVARMGERPPPAAPVAPPEAAAEDARHSLGRIRRLLQEEQFRRGHIR